MRRNYANADEDADKLCEYRLRCEEIMRMQTKMRINYANADEDAKKAAYEDEDAEKLCECRRM